MAQVVRLQTPVPDISIESDNPAGDLVRIRDCARYVKTGIRDTGAAEAWIEAGRVLAELKGSLAKVKKGDNERIGWLKAFELGEFPFSRQTADKLIKVHLYFVAAPKGAPIQTRSLPTSWKALRLIATKLEAAQVERFMASGELSPVTTEKEISALVKSLKPAEAKVRTSIAKDVAKHKEMLVKDWTIGELRELRDQLTQYLESDPYSSDRRPE